MYYYFTANHKSVLKINGKYQGILDLESPPFCYNYDKDFQNNFGEEHLFFEICPINSREVPINFLLDNSIIKNPPDFLDIIDLKGGYLFKVNNCAIKNDFYILAQEKFPFAAITVFYENGLKISIESASDFYADSLNINADSAKIFCFSLDNKNLVCINLLSQKNICICYLIEEKISQVFFREVDEINFENGFISLEKHDDIAKHKVEISWRIENNVLVKNNQTISYDKDYCIENLSEKIIPFAFLEEILCGGSYVDFLHDDMRKNAHLLKDFLGDFIGIFPSPSFRNFDEIGLIYKKNKNFYQAEYFNFDIKDKKICNIKRSDA